MGRTINPETEWYLNYCWITKVHYTYNPDKGKELGFIELKYYWRQIEISVNGESVIYCGNKSDLDKLIANWNSQQPERWEYWT